MIPLNCGYSEIEYPSSRRFTIDLGRVGRGKHHVKALLEIDVTEARGRIKQIRHAGERVSFIAWLIKVIADCSARHPQVHGVNRPRINRVAVFDEVDVSTVIEKEVNGTRVPLPYVIRRADRKTLQQIHAELESAKAQVFEDEGDYVLGEGRNRLGIRLFLGLPGWLRLLLMRFIVFRNPRRIKEMMGTVMVTTAGMAGRRRGWIMPYSIHPLCFAFGSLNEQPAVHLGEIRKREILHLTVLMDHDAVDGVPAARFVEELVSMYEQGFAL